VTTPSSAETVAVPARRSKPRLTSRGAILALITVALLLYMVVPLRTYMEQRNRLAQLERQSQVLEQQKAQLEAQVSKWKDPAYLELVARACLGMVKPGEVSFVVVPKDGEPSQPAICR
jgi:cell division protein FtsB